jgi:tight adherence protein B
VVGLPVGALPIVVLVFVAGTMVTVALSITVEWVLTARRRRVVTAQLEKLVDPEVADDPRAGKLIRGGTTEAVWVQQLSTRLPHLRSLQILMQQADLRCSVQSYLLLSAGLGLSLGGGVLLTGGGFLYALPLACLAAALPYLYACHKRAARLSTLEEQFPQAVDLIARAIRAGHPLPAALKMASEECPEPIASEFRRTFEEIRFGLPAEDTLSGLLDRLPLVDLRIFVTAVLIQREVGGNLAEILDNLTFIIRQRFTLLRQVRVLTAEGRMSMYVLGLLPFAIGLFVFYSSPSYVMTLFTHPAGKIMVAGAVSLQAIGWWWMRKITKIDF